MSRDSRSARLKGESAETLTVTTGDSAENIDLDSAFEKKERRRPTAKGAVVFAGSSTIRFWSTLARDIAPLPAVQRGFGGNRPKSVAQMQQLYDTLLTRLHDRLPRARIVVLATFPSPLNARRAGEIEAVNEYLRETVENKPWLDLLDGNEALKTASGDPDRSLFRLDRVHLNKEGYARWAQILRPKLLAHWREKLN